MKAEQPTKQLKNLDLYKDRVDKLQAKKRLTQKELYEARADYSEAKNYNYYLKEFGPEIASMEYGDRRYKAIEAASHEKQRQETLKVYGERIGNIMDYQERLYAMKEARDKGEVIDDVEGRFKETSEKMQDYSRHNGLRKKHQGYDVYVESEEDYFIAEMHDSSKQAVFEASKEAASLKNKATIATYIVFAALFLSLFLLNIIPFILHLFIFMIAVGLVTKLWIDYARVKAYAIGYDKAYKTLAKIAVDVLPDDNDYSSDDFVANNIQRSIRKQGSL